MARDHPQDKAGDPPPERRCTAMVDGHHYAGPPYRCPQWTMKGRDVCQSHSPDRKNIPSQQPPENRRCQGKAQDADGHLTRPCKLWAMKGLTVCWRHGGSNPITRAAGERRVAEAKIEKKARQLATLFDIVPVDNPLTALSQHVGEEIRFKDIVATLVKDLHAEDIRYTDARGAEQLRSEIVVYERALGRVGDRLLAYAKLNIDERLAKIEEDKLARVVAAVNDVIAYFIGGGSDPVEARRIAAQRLKTSSD
jgi:hypothetical protein